MAFEFSWEQDQPTQPDQPEQQEEGFRFNWEQPAQLLGRITRGALSGFREEKKDVIKKVGGSLAEGPIEFGKQLGTAAAVPFIRSDQKKIAEQQLAQQTILIDRFRKETDPQKKEQLGNRLKQRTEESLFSRSEFQKSPRQVIAAAAETALEIVTAGAAPKILKATRAATRTGRAALRFARTAPIGAAFGVTGEARQAETTAGRVGVQAVLGGFLGGGLGVVAPVVGRGIQRFGRRARPAVEKVAKEAAEEVAPLARPDITATTRAPHFNHTIQKNVHELEQRPGFLEDVQRRGGARVVSNRETVQRAAQLGPLPEKQIVEYKQGTPINTVDIERANQTVEAELFKTFKDFGDGKLSREELNVQLPRLEKLHAGYQLMTAEPGRALQIQQSFIKRGLDVMEGYKKVAAGDITTEGEKQILQDQVKKLLDDAEDSGINKTPMWRGIVEGVEEFATAAKLTSPLTQAINIVSNALTFTTRGTVERPLAAAIGAARRQTGLGELKFAFGTQSGWTSAVKKFANVMRDETQSEISKLSREFKPAIPGAAGRVIRIPFRVLSAADEFWKTILKDSDIHTSAYQRAFQEGARGDALKKRITQLVEKPTEEMLEKAQKVAREFTFQEEPGKFLGGFSSLLRKVPGGKLVIPFIQTPSNIVKFQARRSAIGALSPKNWEDLRGGGAQQNEALARMISGIGMSIGGLMVAQQGNVTGATPKNKADRDKFFREGKKPYSIKVGDRWVSYQRFQPIGLYLLQGAALNEAIERGDEENASQLFGAMASTVAKGISEMPFVEGVNSAMNAITDPDRHGERFITSLITGFIPTVSRDIRKAVDPYVREAEGTFQAIQNMIPGASQDLQPTITAFGQQAKFGGEIGPVERGFGKITAREAISPLETALTEAQFTPGIPGTTLRRGNKTTELKGQERTDFLKEMGEATEQAIQQAIDKPSFAGLTVEAKEKVLKQVVDKSRDRIRNKWKARVFSPNRTVDEKLQNFLE